MPLQLGMRALGQAALEGRHVVLEPPLVVGLHMLGHERVRHVHASQCVDLEASRERESEKGYSKETSCEKVMQ